MSNSDDVAGIIWSAVVAVFGMMALAFIIPFKLFRALPVFAEGIDRLSSKVVSPPSELEETKALWKQAQTLHQQSLIAEYSTIDLCNGLQASNAP